MNICPSYSVLLSVEIRSVKEKVPPKAQCDLLSRNKVNKYLESRNSNSFAATIERGQYSTCWR